MTKKLKINFSSLQKKAALLLFFMPAVFAVDNLYSDQTQKIENKTCLSCHQDKSLFKPVTKEREVSLFVDKSQIAVSAHKDIACQECHSQISEIPHPEELPTVDCSLCHGEEGKSYTSSIHGEAFLAGDQDVPQCSTCHGKHKILRSTDPKSLTYPSRLIQICLSCHLDQKIEKEHHLPGPEIFIAYEQSIHGKAVLKSGLQVSAVCNDCHGSHNIQPADNPKSMVNKVNIPSVCGKCHTKILDDYKSGIHSQALEEGIQEAPVCTDCHGEHSITRISDPESGAYSTNIPKTCSECHESEALAEKFGLPARRLATYMSSYHGVATKFGQVTVANCSSCHGVHNIRPSDDPLSSIHPANLSRTCGNCHPGIGEKTSMGKIHIEAKPESSMGKFVVRRFYYWFIGSLMFIFLLYVFFDIRKHRKMRKMKEKQG